MKKTAYFAFVVFCVFLLSTTAFAEGSIEKSRGQIVYATASHNESDLYLSSTRVFIRNIDLKTPITVISVTVYDHDGDFIYEFLEESQALSPLNTINFSIAEIDWPTPPRDFNDGRPSVLVEWKANKEVIPPRIESVAWIINKASGSIVAMHGRSGSVLKEMDKKGKH